MLFSAFSVSDAEHKDKFEELYIKCRKLVHYIASEYMSDFSLAEDATQETFLKLTRYMDKIEIVDSPQTISFVGIVARNVCIDMLRSENAYRKNTENFHKEKGEATETVTELLEKIRALPEIYRDALLLKYYFDMPNKKISELCNITENTVRKRLERARKLLSEVKV